MTQQPNQNPDPNSISSAPAPLMPPGPIETPPPGPSGLPPPNMPPPNLMPPNMPLNMPPNMPLNMPPGMPPNMPPGMPPNMPPGMLPNMPPGMPPGMPPMPMMPGGPPMPFPMPGMFPPNMMFPGMKPKGKGPQPMDKWANVPPNNTIYVNNLNEKTSRDEIVNGLREVFGQFGKVLDVVCYTKIKRCKGQAWVVMEKTECATKAVREMQNFIFYNKPMRVAYSKNVSDATLKRDGKPVPQRERPPKRKKQKKKIVVEETSKKKKKRKKSKDKAKKGAEEDGDVDMKETNDNTNSANHYNHKEKSDKNKKNTRRINHMAAPNKTLFLQHLPKDVSSEEMQRLFIAFPGFLGVNLIDNKPGIGFAEFDDTYNSSNAQRSLNGFTIHGQDIMVEFAQ
eukprot:116565_1